MHARPSPAAAALTAVAVAALGSLAAARAPAPAAAAGALVAAPAGASGPNAGPDEPAIAQVVAAGRILPAQPVRWIDDTPAVFTLRVSRGEARFEDGAASAVVAVARPGWLVQPPIRPGPPGDASLVEMYTDVYGVPAAPARSVFTTDRAGIRELRDVVPADDPARLDAGEHHVVIDLGAVRDTRVVTVFGAGARRRSESLGRPGARAATTAEGGAHGSGGTLDLPGLDLSGAPFAIDVAAGTAPVPPFGDEARTARGPGIVEWAFADPAEAGFSVKPDAATTLLRPWAAGRAADGLYRAGWGCCAALEVPDSCTVTLLGPDAAFVALCNRVAFLAGRRPRWIDACERPDWPDCPLP